MKLPGGYAPVRTPGAEAFVLESAAHWLQDVLGRGGTLHGWAAAHPERREMAGRGRVYSVPAPAPGPDARSRWVVRHYERGGALARFLGDRYLALGRTRTTLEAEASARARALGIPTPAVVAGASYPAGVFTRADLVTEEVPDSADLARVLFGDRPEGIDPQGALVAAGRLVLRLEREGLHHPDLNAKNVLLRPGSPLPEPWLVDLDRCRVGARVAGGAMRSRLERSLRKFERRTGRTLEPGAWSALRSGWEEGP